MNLACGLERQHCGSVFMPVTKHLKWAIVTYVMCICEMCFLEQRVFICNTFATCASWGKNLKVGKKLSEEIYKIYLVPTVC